MVGNGGTRTMDDRNKQLILKPQYPLGGEMIVYH